MGQAPLHTSSDFRSLLWSDGGEEDGAGVWGGGGPEGPSAASSGLESQFSFGWSPLAIVSSATRFFSGRERTERGPLLSQGWVEVPVLGGQGSRQRPHDPSAASLQTHVLPSLSPPPSVFWAHLSNVVVSRRMKKILGGFLFWRVKNRPVTWM